MSTTDCLDDVLHAAALLLSGPHKYDHITPVFGDELHWLPVCQHIEYKLCFTVFEALHGIMPGYIAAMCVLVSCGIHDYAQLTLTNSILFDKTVN